MMPMANKLPVSVCMLVLNEEDRLVRSLPPLADFAEIVVLDSGSTDRSLELCREHGCRVVEAAWEGFGAMRQRLFGLAKQPWVFWLDADEVVSGELLEALRELFGEVREGGLADAYEVNRIVFFEGKWVRHGDWFPDWNVRLFRNKVWSIEPRAVHEEIEIDGRVGRLRGLLEHYTYRDRGDQRRRSERYARLWAQEQAKRGRRAHLLSAPLHALWRFFRGYFLKGGFRDGGLGFRVAWANAREVWLKYENLRRGRLESR